MAKNRTSRPGTLMKLSQFSSRDLFWLVLVVALISLLRGNRGIAGETGLIRGKVTASTKPNESQTRLIPKLSDDGGIPFVAVYILDVLESDIVREEPPTIRISHAEGKFHPPLVVTGLR